MGGAQSRVIHCPRYLFIFWTKLTNHRSQGHSSVPSDAGEGADRARDGKKRDGRSSNALREEARES
jgi:hypothetical protein